MSRLADSRYNDPAYVEFRELVEGWLMCGGLHSLADAFEAAPATVDRWRLGVVAPRPATRDAVVAWIRGRVA